MLARHQVGISLAYADSARPFYGFQERKYFTPASTMKLFSFYTGLHLLGDSLPSLRYFSRHDTLFFQGTGDPTLLHGDVPSRRAYSFLLNRPEKYPRLLRHCLREALWPRLDLGRLWLLLPARAHGLPHLWQHRALLRHAARAQPQPQWGSCAPAAGGAVAHPGAAALFSRRWWGRPRPNCARPISTRIPTSSGPCTKTASTCCPPLKDGSMKRPS